MNVVLLVIAIQCVFAKLPETTETSTNIYVSANGRSINPEENEVYNTNFEEKETSTSSRLNKIFSSTVQNEKSSTPTEITSTTETSLTSAELSSTVGFLTSSTLNEISLSIVQNEKSSTLTEITSTTETTEISSTVGLLTEPTKSCADIPTVKFTTINASSTGVILHWDPPQNSECLDYYSIYLNNEEYNKTTETELTITNLTACTQYTVAISAVKDNVSGEQTVENFTTALDIPTIEFSTIIPTSFEVILKWEPPENTACIDEYIIYLENNSYRTSKFEMNITDLIACNNYTVGIAASKGEDVGPKSENEFNTVSPNPFNYSVINLNIEKVREDILNITWLAPPNEVVQCITDYYIIWWSESNIKIQEENSTFKTYYEITPIVGCMKYVIAVKPRIGLSQDGNLEKITYEAEAFPNSPPEPIFSTIGKTQINITWQTDDKSKNMCEVTAIDVTCTAPEDSNEDYPWIIRDAESVKNVTNQTSNNRYSMTIGDLSPFTNYSCSGVVINTAGNSSEKTFEVSTDEDVPSAPEPLKITNIGPLNFTIGWTKPEKIPGVMTFYGLKVNSNGAGYTEIGNCINNDTDHYFDVDAEETSYLFDQAFPYYQYTVVIYGVDGAGNGTEASANVTTEAAEPDPVENATILPPEYAQVETYNGTVTVKFDPPCSTKGPFKYYEITFTGKRENFDNHQGSIDTNETESTIFLEPEREYSIEIKVVTENFTSASVSVDSFQSKAGVPVINEDVKLTAPTPDENRAHFTFGNNVFSDVNGEIIAYSLILMTKSQAGGSYGFWDGTNDTWPRQTNADQLTPDFWNPFRNGTDLTTFTIGDGDCGDNFCNEVLTEDTKYWLIIRALTRAGYKDSPLLPFKTDVMEDLDLPLILGLVFGLLALLVLLIFVIFLWRRKKRRTIQEEEKCFSTQSPEPIPCQKFIKYYEDIKENYNVLKQQFTDLGLQSKDVTTAITYATLAENRRKNRYTNILPFDETRVKLKIDEDDEISSDYINASYIKGYSGQIEYIATQGPLESTTRDFWKMVLQENVSVIVMVSQFVEQSKEKCYHYFPNNHESVVFGESLEVKCCTELHFGTYCIRTLQVRKGTEQRHVIHMQFLEWPDFGVPQGTDNMLEFCRQLREKATHEGGVIAVHCSAGVGRTGTLIALDILLQTIDDHRDINIYKTVLDLRKQRSNMVQTEKQYMFIYTCVKDYLETPTIKSTDILQERIYENMDIIKNSSKKQLIEAEIESAL